MVAAVVVGPSWVWKERLVGVYDRMSSEDVVAADVGGVSFLNFLVSVALDQDEELSVLVSAVPVAFVAVGWVVASSEGAVVVVVEAVAAAGLVSACYLLENIAT